LRLFSEDDGGLRYRPRADTEDHHIAWSRLDLRLSPAPDFGKHRGSADLVGRPIAFEEPLGHHSQKSTRMLAVYALVVDDDFDMRRAR
jgi:hypothetical protein